MTINFQFLKHGDCTLISTDEFSMMIDGGYSNPFHYRKFKGQKPILDTVIVTHIDQDHIGGVRACFEQEDLVKNLKYIVFNEPNNSELFKELSNSSNVSTTDGNLLSTVIKYNSHIGHINDAFTTLDEENILDPEITGITKFIILSPSKPQLSKLYDEWRPDLYKESTDVCGDADDHRPINELLDESEKYDTSTPNGSSLAFLILHKSHKFLILGDAHVKQITQKLISMGYRDSDGHRLHLDFIKLSHHGSKYSTSKELLSLVETENYVISNASLGDSKTPDRETIAKIAKYGNSGGQAKRILINNKTSDNLNFTEEEMSHYSFSVQSTSDYDFRY